MSKRFEFRVNGSPRAVEVDPEAKLLSVLRDQLDLTGPKYGCGEGQCGACTVLIDGAPRRSCNTLALAAADRNVVTIEGLAQNGQLHPLQQAFLEVGAFQCGYCTSGMILTGAVLLERSPDPSEDDIIRFMNGNICRCGTYPRIVAAIRKAAGMRREPQK